MPPKQGIAYVPFLEYRLRLFGHSLVLQVVPSQNRFGFQTDAVLSDDLKRRIMGYLRDEGFLDMPDQAGQQLEEA